MVAPHPSLPRPIYPLDNRGQIQIPKLVEAHLERIAAGMESVELPGTDENGHRRPGALGMSKDPTTVRTRHRPGRNG